MPDIDISGLDPAEVLVGLYNRAGARHTSFLNYDSNPMTIEEAREVLGNPDLSVGGYINGRAVKARFNPEGTENILRADLYDRDYGEGTAQSIVDALRNKTPLPVHPDQTEEMSAIARLARRTGQTEIAKAVEQQAGANFLKKTLGSGPDGGEGNGGNELPAPKGKGR